MKTEDQLVRNKIYLLQMSVNWGIGVFSYFESNSTKKKKKKNFKIKSTFVKLELTTY